MGTGSTVYFFIEQLIVRCHQGLRIQAVASSRASYAQAHKGNIPFLDEAHLTEVDITVDGADEIDPKKRMIKGGGGALLREKILANMSRELVVIVDETKLKARLGVHRLPVEILPFAYMSTLHKLQKLGYQGEMRKQANGSLFVTDNGNYLIDIAFEHPRDHPERDHEVIASIPGVLETGFFFHLAGRVLVGFTDGQVVVKS